MRSNRSTGMGLVMMLAAAILVHTTGHGKAQAVDEYVPDQLVCRTVNQFVLDTINQQYGTGLLEFLPLGNSYLLVTPPGADLEALSEEISLNPNVLYCEPNYLLDAPEPVQSSQPFLDEMQVGTYPDQDAALALQLAAAQANATGDAVKVAVIDAGVTATHPAFEGATITGYDYIANAPVVTDPGGAAEGHGTFVAGVVNLVAPESQLKAYRVIDTAGSGNGFEVAEAVLRAVSDGCKVINLSMVMAGKHSALDDAIEYAHDNNVLVVAAAGNDSAEVERFPARDSYVLAVAGLDSANYKADFSNWNGKVDVCAPSTGIYSPFADTTYAWWNGTSFATPFVAGLAALLWEIMPNATVGQIIDAITETATNIDGLNPEYEGGLGAGLIDPVAAVQYMMNLEPNCGDMNHNGGSPNVADLTFLVSHLFKGGPAPAPQTIGDLNGNGAINVADLTYMVNYLFKGGPVPTCGP